MRTKSDVKEAPHAAVRSRACVNALCAYCAERRDTTVNRMYVSQVEVGVDVDFATTSRRGLRVSCL